MERKNLWKLGENKANFLSSRGSNKRKRTKVQKKSSRKSAKFLKKKQSEPVSAMEKSGSRKQKRKLSEKKHPVNKKKCKKNEEDEKLPERFLLPDELKFENILFKRKKYRLNPTLRDGNCLFSAVADQVCNDQSYHDTLREWCVNFMKEHEELFTEFIGANHQDFIRYIKKLEDDGTWGDNPEITALSKIFKCPIEIYQNSLIPTVIVSDEHRANIHKTIRIYYANNHYSSVRPDGQGGQLFDFEALQPGELDKQMALLKDDHSIQNGIVSEQDPSADEKNYQEGIKQSKAFHEALKNYKRFYAARVRNHKLPKKKHSVKRNKSRKENEEKKLTKPYLLLDEQLFENYLFRRKGYRFTPIKRDGNCLFRAVAHQIYGDPNLHSMVRKWCAKFMKEEKKFYEGFILHITDFSKYIKQLGKDGTWGGNFELMAISELYNCRLEVYEKSENPRVVNAWDFQGSNNPPIRLFFRNNHYASVISSGGLNNNFQAMEPGDMEQKMLSQCQFLKSKDFQNNSKQSVEDISIADPQLYYAIQLSKAMEESRKSFLLYYAEEEEKQHKQQ